MCYSTNMTIKFDVHTSSLYEFLEKSKSNNIANNIGLYNNLRSPLFLEETMNVETACLGAWNEMCRNEMRRERCTEM